MYDAPERKARITWEVRTNALRVMRHAIEDKDLCELVSCGVVAFGGSKEHALEALDEAIEARGEGPPDPEAEGFEVRVEHLDFDAMRGVDGGVKQLMAGATRIVIEDGSVEGEVTAVDAAVQVVKYDWIAEKRVCPDGSYTIRLRDPGREGR